MESHLTCPGRSCVNGDISWFNVLRRGRTRSSIAGLWIWICILNTSIEWFMDCGDTGAVRVIYQKSATHSVVIYDSVRDDETSVFTWLSLVLIFCLFSAVLLTLYEPPIQVSSAAISVVCGSISGQYRLKFYFFIESHLVCDKSATSTPGWLSSNH